MLRRYLGALVQSSLVTLPWHCLSDEAGQHYTTLSCCWLEIIRAATNKPKHHNICTHQHQHNCRVITTAAPPLLRPVLLLGRSSGVTIATVLCWSHLGAILITRERIIILVLVSSSPPAVRGAKCEVGPCAALVIIYLLDIKTVLTIIIVFIHKNFNWTINIYGVTHVITFIDYFWKLWNPILCQVKFTKQLLKRLNHLLTQNKSMTHDRMQQRTFMMTIFLTLKALKKNTAPQHHHHTAVVSAAGLLLVRRQQCSWVTTPVPATTLSSAACSDTTTTTTTTELWSDYGHYPDRCDLAAWTSWLRTHPPWFSSSQLSVFLTINVGWDWG